MGARFADATVLRLAHALYAAGIAGVPAPEPPATATDSSRWRPEPVAD
ncbi:hypothetical protein ACWD6I_25975 [Streptomyces sp. NPDC002454]